MAAPASPSNPYASSMSALFPASSPCATWDLKTARPSPGLSCTFIMPSFPGPALMFSVAYREAITLCCEMAGLRSARKRKVSKLVQQCLVGTSSGFVRDRWQIHVCTTALTCVGVSSCCPMPDFRNGSRSRHEKLKHQADYFHHWYCASGD